MADGWRFSLEPGVAGAEKPGFDDSSWSPISVPHSWNRVGYYRSDPQTHQNSAAVINKTLGVGWYRLRFTPPATFAGKRAWLQFDAASRIAQVC
ncbi:MAG: sugar-binding domain-containing protein [Janthinobacterium lividum]